MAINKIVFFGSDGYSLSALSEIIKSGKIDISLVVTTENSDIVRVFAQKNNLPITIWESAEAVEKKLASIAPRLGILASFGKIIPDNILNKFPYGILNLHPSLLPKYRGPSPVPTAILNNDTVTGVSIIKLDEKIDHGPIIAQQETRILPEETSNDLLLRLFKMGAEKLVKILPDYLDGKIKLTPQNEALATYTRKLLRADGKIDFSQSPEAQYRQIRALQPWPGAWAEVKILRDRDIKILRIKILKAHLKDGKLVLDEVQLEGKRPVSGKQFNEGYPEAKLI